MKKYEVLSPGCFSRFSCKGGECRNDCCSGWSITLSKDEHKKIRKKLSDEDSGKYFCKKNSDSGRILYQVVLDEAERCPFLTGDRLCELQLKFGPGILSDTCRQFPRVYHKYLNKAEGGLSLGCEAVLELLLEEKDGLELTSYVKKISDDQNYFRCNVDEKKRNKYPALIYYYDIQNLCLNLLQAEDATLEERLILLGVAIRHIDILAEEGRAGEIPGYINSYLDEIESIDASGQIANIKGDNIAVLYNNFMLLVTFVKEKRTIEIAKRLHVDLERTYQVDDNGKVEYTIECSEEAYRTGQENFRRFIKGREYFLENMMVAWMFYSNMPFSKPEEGVWRDYVHYVWGYSMIKFVLTMTLNEDSTEQDMIDTCAAMFRKLAHNPVQRKAVLKQFEDHESNSLAHMALLLKS